MQIEKPLVGIPEILATGVLYEEGIFDQKERGNSLEQLRQKQPLEKRTKRVDKKETLAPPQEGFLETVDHEALHYSLYGESGPLLVLCDGVGCEGFIWKYLIPEFSKDHRVLHWQYRGHGKSSPPEDLKYLTIEQLAKDLDVVLSHCAPGERAILLGHSMGTQVILEYHKQFSERVAALIPICGGAGKTIDGFLGSKSFKYFFPYILQLFRTVPELSEIFWNRIIAHPQGYYPAILFKLTSTLCAKEDLAPYLDHLGRIDPRVFMELSADMARHSLVDYLPEIHCPTLVIAGNRDHLTPLPKSEIIAKCITNAELCVVRKGTHTAPLEMPELIHLRIRKFLEERLNTPVSN